MRWFFFISLVLALAACIRSNDLFAETPDHRPSVLHVRLDDEAITPVVARFLRRALREAQNEGYECVVIELDTPGGLMDSTQQIVKDILDARIAVIVYVSPAGGRAASAGLFITLSSHLAAMAPGTRIGAAHPVQIGALPIGPQPVPSDERKEETDSGDEASRHEPIEEKIVNDTVAWAKGLAQMRGRNIEWAALAVSKSEVLTSSEAIRDNVVELQATDLSDLLEKIHGREILIDQKTVRIRTADAEVRTMEMWWGERFLAVISNPNVVMQTLVEVGTENNTTIVFPVPIELASTFLKGASSSNGKPQSGEPRLGPVGEPMRT